MTETDQVVVNSTVSDGKIMITSSLKFKEVARQDSGVYTCEANNLIGAAMAETVNLMVVGKWHQVLNGFRNLHGTFCDLTD